MTANALTVTIQIDTAELERQMVALRDLLRDGMARGWTAEQVAEAMRQRPVYVRNEDTRRLKPSIRAQG
jgi:hypothetical protein